MINDGKDESTDRLDDVIDRFTQAIRSGDTPSLSYYVNENPDLESEIRELLPLVSMVEGARKNSVDRSQPPIQKPQLPPKIEGYRVIQEIGRGGMGIVYEAEQLSPRRRVAIKVLSSTNDVLACERFRREADSAAQLQHPNVLPVFEVGQTPEVAYYTMQLIEGFALDQIRDQISSFRSASANVNSLSDVARSLVDYRHAVHSTASIRNRRSPEKMDSKANDQAARIYYHNVARIIAQVAEAVEYSHSKGIIHRDIKPSNVLIDKAGQVWVRDFGLAKFKDDDLTRTGDVVGSVRYMSPERFNGQCDERADVYSLGVTLYELLTLQPPFSSPDKLQIIQQICSRDPISPRVIDRRIPIELETIVLKAMSKEPERRYATAGEFASDLYRYIHDQPIRARRMSQLEKALRWASRNKTLAASLTITAIACTLVIVGLSRLATTREIARKNESILRDNEVTARKEAEAEALANQQNLYFANINLAIRSLESAGGIVSSRNTIREWNPKDHPKLNIGWEWYFLASKVNPEFLVIHGNANILWHDWNQDTSNPKLAFVERNRLVVMRLPGGSIEFETTLEYVATCVLWLRSNELAIGNNSGGIQLLNLDDTATRQWLKFDSCITGLQQNAEQTELAVSTKRKVFVVDLDDDRKTQADEVLSVANGLRWQPFSWHPRESRLAVITGNRQFTIVDTDGIRPAVFGRTSSAAHAIHWNHDGTSVLVGGTTGSIMSFDLNSLLEERTFHFHRHYVKALSLANRSRQIASAGADRRVVLWELETSNPSATLLGAEDYVQQLRFSSDDRWVSAACRDNSIRIWRTPSETETASRRINTWGGCQHAIAFHPKNSKVFAVENHASIALFQSTSDSQTPSNGYHRVLPYRLNVPGNINTISWNPRGDRLVWACNLSFGWFDSKNENPEQPISMDVDFPIASVGFSPNGKRIARGGYGGFDIFDMESEKVIFSEQLGNRKIKAIEYSPDGKWIVAGGYGALRIYQADSPKLVREIETTGITTRVSFSPDGSTLAVASGKGVVNLVDFATGSQIGMLEGHSQDVFSVDWHPHDERIASGGSDGAVRIWDAKSQRQVLAFRTETTPILSVEWSPNGRSLVSVSSKGEIAIRHVNDEFDDSKP